MSVGNTSRRIFWLLILAIFFLATSAMNSPNESSDCDIIVSLPNTTAFPFTELAIPVFLDNLGDTIVGFSIWIQTSGTPGAMAFQTDSGISMDTTYWQCVSGTPPNCTDSINVPPDSVWDFIHVDSYAVVIANFDTTGTLIAGWEYVDTRSFSGNGTDLLVVGIANLPGGPIIKGFAPQVGGTLIKILADVFEDTDPFTDSIVHLQINRDLKDNLNFATSPPQNFWLPIPFLDTNCFVCTQWDIDNTQNPPETLGCLAYMQTPFPPCDSMEIVLDTFYMLDTSKICLNNGSVKILPPYICGDLNGDGNVGNILDLTFLVNRIFRGGPESNPPQAGDVNCDGGNGNILDLTKIVDRIFRSGPPLCTAPSCN